MFRILAFLLLCLALPVVAAPRAQAEIDALIARVAQARDVTFIRNGSEHDAAEAATHLRRKRAAAGGRIRTSEEFIDGIGSRSSITGIAYRVRLADGREIESAVWLRQLLREIRAQRVSTPPAAATVVPSPAPARR